MKKPMRFRRFLCWLLGHRTGTAHLDVWYNQGANSDKINRIYTRPYCWRCKKELERRPHS